MEVHVIVEAHVVQLEAGEGPSELECYLSETADPEFPACYEGTARLQIVGEPHAAAFDFQLSNYRTPAPQLVVRRQKSNEVVVSHTGKILCDKMEHLPGMLVRLIMYGVIREVVRIRRLARGRESQPEQSEYRRTLKTPLERVLMRRLLAS